jgi:hypothetical protein
MSEIFHSGDMVAAVIGSAERSGTIVRVTVSLTDSRSKVVYFFDGAQSDIKIVNVLTMIGLPIPMDEAESSSCGIQSSHYAFAIEPQVRDYYSSLPAPCDRIEWERHLRQEAAEQKALNRMFGIQKPEKESASSTR